MNTTCYESIILRCLWCNQDIYTCDYCGEYFKDKSQIYCDINKNKHYCKDCISLIGGI